ncbi:MAG: adenylyl-sulfate kinase [Chthoniobacterales bacterium]|nr:adenylyl-sulfate kinase [Chthoniobacterales bacterium]
MSASSPLPSEAQRLKIVFVGHVDHGKSTLIGRILHDTGSLPEGKVAAIQQACAAEGMEFEYAFLLDALLEEQAQNITIDTTQIPFRTARRQYVIIDAPGHKEFLKNMITGAASANAAVLVVAANEGVREQSRRHAYLLGLLGIRQVIVVVNKMDLVGYAEATFREIESEYGDFLATLGIEPRLFIPASARAGENVARRGQAAMDWYAKWTLLEALDELEAVTSPLDQPLRFCVQDVYRFDERRIIAGRVESGSLRVGDELVFSPTNKTAIVATIESWGETTRAAGVAGDSIGFTLREQIFVERGYVASHQTETPILANRFHAEVFWLAEAPLRKEAPYVIRLATQEIKGQVVAIEQVMDSSTLAISSGEITEVARNEVGRVTFQTRAPLVFDNHDRVPSLGRLVVMDGGTIAGGGIIFGGAYTTRAEVKSKNIVWSDSKITAQRRALQNGHRGAVVWLTGLSGAGKSTLAQALEAELFARGMHTYVLDGDNIRHGLNTNLGFSPEDRVENIRRVSEVAKLLADSGAVAITAFISPYRIDRGRAREIALEAQADFIEVFVDAPLAVCEERDPKNLYKKARAGEIRDFTGIDAPYEAPEDPEIVVPTAEQSVDESVAAILEQLLPRLRAAE